MVNNIFPIASKFDEDIEFSITGTNLLSYDLIKITANGVSFPVQSSDIEDTVIKTKLPNMMPGYYDIVIQCDSDVYSIRIIRYLHDLEPSLIDGTEKMQKASISLLFDSDGIDGRFGKYIEIPVNPLSKLYEIKTKISSNIVKIGEIEVNDIQLTSGDIVYLTNQNISSENGIWTVNTTNWVQLDSNVDGDVVDFGAYASEKNNDISDKILKRIVFDPSNDGVGSITYYILSSDYILSSIYRRIRITNGESIINTNKDNAVYDVKISNKSENFTLKKHNYRYDFL